MVETMPIDRSRINALMDDASSGDDAAFGMLAPAVQDELFRLGLANGLRREDAAEVTQETLMRAYARRAGWHRGADAMGWLCGIAMNVVREILRKNRRRPWPGANGHQVPDKLPAAPAADEEEWDPDQLARLREAVADLPARQREAVACRYLRQMSIRETAEVMGCAEGTVKSAVSTALERLRAILKDTDDYELQRSALGRVAPR
jgi:RNA polymerase sigma-70 factor (ECF subfamily)